MVRLMACLSLVACSAYDFSTPKYGFGVSKSLAGNYISGEEIDARFDLFREEISDWSTRDWPGYAIRFWDQAFGLRDSQSTNEDVKFVDVAGSFSPDFWLLDVVWWDPNYPSRCEAPAMIHEFAHYWQWIVNEEIDYGHKQSVIWLAVARADERIGCD